MARLILGPFELVPQIDKKDKPVPDRWALPGRQIVTSAECHRLAKRNNWSMSVINKPLH